MTSFDYSWKALLKPGLTEEYFEVHRERPFQYEVTSYSPVNAWWLGELCRLIYRQGADELGSGAQPRTRSDILSEVGLREIGFFDQGGTQCALVAPLNADGGDGVMLVFRGTNELKDWCYNLNALKLPAFRPESWPGGGHVHPGFREALDRVWGDVERELDGRQSALFYAGHSLGAALATLAASRRPPRALYTFGSPRVGDGEFAATLSGCPVFRVVNNRDVVTTVPPPIRDFVHVGELHYIAQDGSVRTDPPEAEIAADRLQKDASFDLNRGLFEKVVNPPEYLADHAPVNYVAHLERALG